MHAFAVGLKSIKRVCAFLNQLAGGIELSDLNFVGLRSGVLTAVTSKSAPTLNDQLHETYKRCDGTRYVEDFETRLVFDEDDLILAIRERVSRPLKFAIHGREREPVTMFQLTKERIILTV